ncbi:MAG TPA: dockerin type I domain-containing protein, partial [Chthoniobacterales bacterium]|nr:dockerin type I domain-containing protein [Chthoniobacterales bacterium]
LPQSNFNADGTISIYVPKTAFGNPKVGDLLGAIGGRTLTGDDPNDPQKIERSNAFIDHTFVKAQADNSYPPATYMLAGNVACSATGILPIGAVSHKTHGSAGTFDVDLPLSGPEGIEPRSGGANGDHTIVVTFAAPVTVGSASCAGQPATTSTNGSVVTVNCSGVPNAQNIAITLLNVSDGTNTGNVSIPMGVLLGDTNADRFTDAVDTAQTKSQSGRPVTTSNFREDVNADGFIDAADVSVVKSKSGTALPPQ